MRADVWLVNTSQATTGFRFDHYRAKGTSGGEGRPMVGVMTELLPSRIGILGSHVPRLTRCTFNFMYPSAGPGGRTLETFDL